MAVPVDMKIDERNLIYGLILDEEVVTGHQ